MEERGQREWPSALTNYEMPALGDLKLWHQVDEGLQVLEKNVPGLREGYISKGHEESLQLQLL